MITSLRGGISASGNISFRQAATRAADVASDSAYQWVLAQMAVPTGLDNDIEPVNTAAATTTARYYATLAGADIACKKDGVADATPQSYRLATRHWTLTARHALRIAGKPSGCDITMWCIAWPLPQGYPALPRSDVAAVHHSCSIAAGARKIRQR
jgi:hypothetical protein